MDLVEPFMTVDLSDNMEKDSIEPFMIIDGKIPMFFGGFK